MAGERSAIPQEVKDGKVRCVTEMENVSRDGLRGTGTVDVYNERPWMRLQKGAKVSLVREHVDTPFWKGPDGTPYHFDPGSLPHIGGGV